MYVSKFHLPHFGLVRWPLHEGMQCHPHMFCTHNPSHTPTGRHQELNIRGQLGPDDWSTTANPLASTFHHEMCWKITNGCNSSSCGTTNSPSVSRQTTRMNRATRGPHEEVNYSAHEIFELHKNLQRTAYVRSVWVTNNLVANNF